jgi:chemotaxis family two-component system response regulator Rcp1
MMVEQSEKTIEVLYIEDNPGDVRLVKEALKGSRVPFHLESAPDGIEALLRVNQLGRFSENGNPDLILLDLNLPKLNGFRVLHEVRANSLLDDVPVLILSSSQNKADVDEAQNLKAALYISKPEDIDGYRAIAEEIEDFWLRHRRISF